jgi:hypothetical protein
MPEYMTLQGDNMEDWLWDGPEDSDEEIEDMIPLKTDQEKQLGIKFSKNGMIKFIENFIKHESCNSSNP